MFRSITPLSGMVSVLIGVLIVQMLIGLVDLVDRLFDDRGPPVTVLEGELVSPAWVLGAPNEVLFTIRRSRRCAADVWQFWKAPDGRVIHRPAAPLAGGYSKPTTDDPGNKRTITVEITPPDTARMRQAETICYAARIDSHCGNGEHVEQQPPVCAPVAR
jgi:hypothetical protein